MNKTLFVLLSILPTTITSCSKIETQDKHLYNIRKLIDVNPNSAYSILRTKKNIILPSEKETALYCLLLTKVMDKTYQSFTSDSIINIALNFYKKEKHSITH